MAIHKCGECANAQPAPASIQRVVKGLYYCPEVEEYVREDDGQCLYFKSGPRLYPVMQPRAHEESYTTEGGLST